MNPYHILQCSRKAYWKIPHIDFLHFSFLFSPAHKTEKENPLVLIFLRFFSTNFNYHFFAVLFSEGKKMKEFFFAFLMVFLLYNIDVLIYIILRGVIYDDPIVRKWKWEKYCLLNGCWQGWKMSCQILFVKEILIRNWWILELGLAKWILNDFSEKNDFEGEKHKKKLLSISFGWMFGGNSSTMENSC